MKFPKLIKKNLKLNNVKFEYDCGDLWLRKNVSLWDDQDSCWDKEILHFIEGNTLLKNQFSMKIKIKKFKWRMRYTIPYLDQIKGLKSGQKYKIKKDNIHYCDLINFEKHNLSLTDDILLYDPKIIIKFINQLEDLKTIYFGMNLMSEGFLELEEDDDEYIRQVLKNPDWWTTAFDPSSKDDLDDIKLIKKSIDPDIKFDFAINDEGENIYRKEGII